MMESLRLAKNRKIERNIIKDVTNSFRLKKKKQIHNTIKDIENLFRLKKENGAIKDRIIRNIRKLFEHEEQDYLNQ